MQLTDIGCDISRDMFPRISGQPYRVGAKRDAMVWINSFCPQRKNQVDGFWEVWGSNTALTWLQKPVLSYLSYPLPYKQENLEVMCQK